MAVLLIATLDTKGREAAFLRERLQAAGVAVLTMDVGSHGPPTFAAEVTREAVFTAANTSLSLIGHDRGRAVEAAARGAARLTQQLYQQGRIAAVLSLGGSAGTTIGTAAMRELPLGVPKLMVSTLASGQVAPYVGVRDILMFHSVVDLCGLNRMSRAVLTNAAAAMAGMVRADRPAEATGEATDRPLLGASMFGVTTPCVEACRHLAESAGYEVLVFHATGTGGRTLESLLADGLLSGVLDLTTTELADELVGGVLSAGPNRLTAAALAGVPQVLSLGALDMVNFGPPNTVPERFAHRRFYQHNASVTLMRTTPEENDQLGKQIAEKASAARGPTAILIPRGGLSAIDCEGQPFWWPEADAALFESLQQWTAPAVEIIDSPHHINDPEFAQLAWTTLQRLMASRSSA